ncbi:hypothetical protein GCK72_022567 [Caenorhabditis remanei]|uniref:Uncharacterized protein n=1 Tax=Caenorhabditis remanei TaxID=31234 RepID=A0A6A5FUD3_CAERE|nr:hypothetical protein GCK72_022567 [Caenorhabditis remanei]KAF1746115.1 hypothetical protein GCK72_022567 [Caenorhabditis remanei]
MEIGAQPNKVTLRFQLKEAQDLLEIRDEEMRILADQLVDREADVEQFKINLTNTFKINKGLRNLISDGAEVVAHMKKAAKTAAKKERIMKRKLVEAEAEATLLKKDNRKLKKEKKRMEEKIRELEEKVARGSMEGTEDPTNVLQSKENSLAKQMEA